MEAAVSPELALALVAPPAIAAAAIALLLRSRASRLLVDHPNARSLHVTPTPRLGGIGVMAGFLPVAAWLAGTGFGLVLACAGVLAVISAVDDWRSLPVAVRLGAHLAAGLAMGYTLAGSIGVGAAVGLALATAWMTNLYNFMDGSDGLSGTMALLGFGTLSLAAVQAGQLPLALVCGAAASASAGFLAFNLPPARVFLGDAGSVPLGFLAAALGGCGAANGAWPGWFPLLVFSPFIVDASLTLARRALRGERVWIAHRSHYYQRLVLSGWSPRRLLAAEFALMLAAAACALVALRAGEMLQCGILVGWSFLLVALVVAIEIRVPRTRT